MTHEEAVRVAETRFWQAHDAMEGAAMFRAIDAYLEARGAVLCEAKPVAWRWVWKTTGSPLEQRFADPDLYEWSYRHDMGTTPSEKMDVEYLYTSAALSDKGDAS